MDEHSLDIRLPLLTFANVYSLHGNDYLLPLLLFLLLPFVHFVSFRLVHFVRSLGRSICITFVFKPIPEIEWPISISNRQVENCFTGCDPNRVNCYLAAHLTTNKKENKVRMVRVNHCYCYFSTCLWLYRNYFLLYSQRPL